MKVKLILVLVFLSGCSYRSAYEGMQVPLTLFSSYLFLFLFQGILFSILWGLMSLWLQFWLWFQFPFNPLLMIALLAGVFFELSMSAFYCCHANKHHLPLWKDYGKDKLL